MPFGNSIGWYAFLSLIPFILLYLIRPKPKEKMIPSLMFFMRDKGFFRHSTFLRRILHNLLFILQLLAILLLAFSLTEPYSLVDATIAAENTIIVIDASASMQTKEGSSTRFERAVDLANGHLSGKVSIVMAANIPIVLLDKGSGSEARDALSTIEARDTATNIGDAMLTAINIVEGEKGLVYVFSDFNYNEGPDPIAAKRALLASGLEVELIEVSGEAKNAGIIALDVGRLDSKATVKNFNDEPLSLALQVGTKTFTKMVAADSIETFTFETPQGITQIELKPQDDLLTDNYAYISAPDTQKTNVLLITNAEKSNIKTALQAARDIKLTVSEPPVVPAFEYDVIIIHKVDLEFMLPGFYEEIEKMVKGGRSLIITAQEKMPEWELIPVSLGKTSEESSGVVFSESSFTKHIITKHIANRYFLAEPSEELTPIATLEKGDIPLITLSKYETGNVVYYGIFDEYSTFKSSTDYPIFWNGLINYLMQREDLADYNFATGRTLIVPEQKVQTPSGSVETTRVIFDKVGKYSFDGRDVVANLLNEEESEISGDGGVKEEEAELLLGGRREKARDDFQLLIAAIAACLLLAELIYIKYRGDI